MPLQIFFYRSTRCNLPSLNWDALWHCIAFPFCQQLNAMKFRINLIHWETFRTTTDQFAVVAKDFLLLLLMNNSYSFQRNKLRLLLALLVINFFCLIQAQFVVILWWTCFGLRHSSLAWYCLLSFKFLPYCCICPWLTRSKIQPIVNYKPCTTSLSSNIHSNQACTQTTNAATSPVQPTIRSVEHCILSKIATDLTTTAYQEFFSFHSGQFKTLC